MISNEKHAKKSPEGLQMGPKVWSNTLWEQIMKVPSGGRADQAFYSFFWDGHHVRIILRCWKQWWPQICSIKIFWCSYRAKMGCFLPFLGAKIETHILSIFDDIFLQEVKDLFFGGSQKIFESQWTNDFETTAILSGQKGVYLPFFRSKFKLNFSEQFWWDFFTSCERTIFLRFPKKISALTDERFWSYGRFKRPKRGIFALFWVKIQTHISEQLWWDFFTSCERTIFLRFPKKISALTDERFWSYGRSKRPKRGIFALFWVKNQTQFSEQLWWDFFTSCERTIFLRFPKKISAITDKRFGSYDHFKRPKRGIFARFWVKIQNQFSEQLWWDFFTSCERTIFWGYQKKFQP